MGHGIGMWDGMAGGMGGLAWVWMLIWVGLALALLVLAVAGAVWLARGAGGRSGSLQAAPTASAREALDLRYARGEISREEYRRARADLADAPEPSGDAGAGER